MIDLPYSLIIEATDEPDYFGFYSTDLQGFTGIGHSIEDCLYKARWGMKEHVALLKEQSEEGISLPIEEGALVVDSLSRSLNPTESAIDKKWGAIAKAPLKELK